MDNSYSIIQNSTCGQAGGSIHDRHSRRSDQEFMHDIFIHRLLVGWRKTGGVQVYACHVPGPGSSISIPRPRPVALVNPAISTVVEKLTPWVLLYNKSSTFVLSLHCGVTCFMHPKGWACISAQPQPLIPTINRDPAVRPHKVLSDLCWTICRATMIWSRPGDTWQHINLITIPALAWRPFCASDAQSRSSLRHRLALTWS